MSSDSQFCRLSAFSQSGAKCDLGTTLKAELFKVIQHGNQNRNVWHGVSPKGTVFMGIVHASKHSKTIERWKTVDFIDRSLI